MVEDQIRQALRDYERREGITQAAHAGRLGLSAMTLSDFLRGSKGMGVPMAKAIRARHPELLYLLLNWLETPAKRRETPVATP